MGEVGAIVPVLLLALLVVAACLAASGIRLRALRRRVRGARLRLEPGAPAAADGDGEVAELERATTAVAGRLAAAGDVSARLCGALEAVPQAVVLYDGEGREAYRNRAAMAFAGGRHADAVVEQAIRDQLDALGDGSPEPITLELFGPPRRILVVSASPVLSEGRRLGSLVVVDDVSERRRLEEVRRDFVANISHELKTPVGALGVLAETIATTEGDLEVNRRLAKRMTEEALRVGRIIDDLLDLSRIEAEEAPRREAVAVRLVVAEATERVRPLAQSRRIVVDAAAVPGDHVLKGDRRQLVSAVANLLENACKYSEAGSTVEIQSEAGEGAVEIEVRDHGIGIPRRDLERVFERFYRVDRARSRETGGTGLGLAIVRHVATNHGGEVRVESQEGQGSVFTLRLPGELTEAVAVSP